jgi:hypothetical protein
MWVEVSLGQGVHGLFIIVPQERDEQNQWEDKGGAVGGGLGGGGGGKAGGYCPCGWCMPLSLELNLLHTTHCTQVDSISLKGLSHQFEAG